MRSACSALVLALLVACGTTAAPTPSSSPTAGSRDVPFSNVAATSNSRQDGGTTILVGTSDQRTDLIRSLVPTIAAPAPASTLVAAFQGEQRTGGYSISITAIERDGDRLIVRANFFEPPAGAVLTEVITSPAYVVSIAMADLAGAKTAILVDNAGMERARVNLT